MTLHKATLFDLYFAHSHLPYPRRRWRRRQRQGGSSWVASTPRHWHARFVSCQQRCADCKSWSAEFAQRSTSSDNSNTQSWVSNEAKSECYSLVIVQTGLCDKMLTDCNITASNDSVIYCDNMQFNHSFIMSFSSYQENSGQENCRHIIHVSLWIPKILRICICKWTHLQTALQYVLVCPPSRLRRLTATSC